MKTLQNIPPSFLFFLTEIFPSLQPFHHAKGFSNQRTIQLVSFGRSVFILSHFTLLCFAQQQHLPVNRQHHGRTLPCSSAALTLTLICSIFLALIRRSCIALMFPCSKDFLLLAFHQWRCVLCESSEIENVLAQKKKNKSERKTRPTCLSSSLGKSPDPSLLRFTEPNSK